MRPLASSVHDCISNSSIIHTAHGHRPIVSSIAKTLTTTIYAVARSNRCTEPHGKNKLPTRNKPAARQSDKDRNDGV